MPRWMLLIMIWYNEERERFLAEHPASRHGPSPVRIAELMRHLYEHYEGPEPAPKAL